jgi:oxaloacetate decarboxylase alpha subunit
VRQFVLCATESGTSRIRAVDPLNDPEALLVGAEAAREAGAVFVPSLIVGPAPRFDDARWAREAQALAQLPGASAICVSDGAGHLPPAAVAGLLRAVQAVCDLPIEVQVQAPGGMAPLLATAAVEAGAAAVQASAGAVALVSSRPSAETMRAALTGGARAFECDRRGLERAARTVGPMLPADRLRQAAGTLFGPAVAIPPALEVGLVARLGRLGLTRNLGAVADEAARVVDELGAVTFAYPLGSSVLAQAARHVIEGRRYDGIEEPLVHAALGRSGRVRGPVDPGTRAIAEAHDPGPRAAPPELADLARLAPSGASDEDLVLWALFGEEAEPVLSRRASFGAETDRGGDAPALIDRALVEQLVEVVEGSSEAEVSLEVGGARVTVRRVEPAAAGAAPQAGGDDAEAAASLLRVESPMVGTFYRSSSPEADPFVEPGTEVEPGQTLCLLEAMKLFNEITADHAGIVKEICVENAESVEYGQLLFLIEP